MGNPIIDVQNISKTFKVVKRREGFAGTVAGIFHPQYERKTVVDKVSFQINEGEMVGFIGPNGAGKSTTVKMLSGILYPDSGVINVDGFIPHKDRKNYVAEIGVVIGHKTQISWDLTPLDSYEVIRRIYKIPEKKYKRNLERLTSMLEIEPYLNQTVRTLSLGQRMRAEIAAALLHSPKIVFFDEATIGVDVMGKDKIRSFLRELNRTDNITMIFTTHDLQDIVQTCDRLLIIDKGKKLYDGSLENIQRTYSSQRIMSVEFEEMPCKFEFDNVFVKNTESRKNTIQMIFDIDKINYNDFISYLIESYKVSDITVKEPDIELIIRDIYTGRVIL